MVCLSVIVKPWREALAPLGAVAPQNKKNKKKGSYRHHTKFCPVVPTCNCLNVMF